MATANYTSYFPSGQVGKRLCGPALCMCLDMYLYIHVHTYVLACVRVLLDIFLWAIICGVPQPN